VKTRMCECRDGCQCAHKPGIAVYKVRRGDRELYVCSYCNLLWDEILEEVSLSPEDEKTVLESDDIFAITRRLGRIQNPN